MSYSIVCLSSQAWDAPLPTNRQQIMRRAAQRGHEVLYVETSDFLARHLLRRSPHALRAASVDPNVVAVKAVNLAPWGRKVAAACAVNNVLSALRLRRLVSRLPKPVVAWVYDPCAIGLAERLPVAFTVYDCVDDYAEQTRGDARRHALVTAAERRTAAVARVAFATSRPQFAKLAAANENTHLVRNVGEFAHFAVAADRAIAPPELQSLPRPVIGFAGNLLPGKVDFELVARAARARPEWTFLCVGPAPEPSALAPWRALPNIHLHGAVPYADLPRYVAAFDVGFIPYLSNAYTRSCFPLKLYEYLAAGKAVVATGLPELAGLEPDVVLADGDEQMLAALAAGTVSSAADTQRRQRIAASNTWETRAARLLSLVAEALP